VLVCVGLSVTSPTPPGTFGTYAYEIYEAGKCTSSLHS
jgi:hypothetical protein